MMSNPARAIEKWVAEAGTYGPLGNGVVFCDSSRDADRYMDLVENRGIVPPFSRLRAFNGPVRYTLNGNKATLSLFVIAGIADATAATQEQWPLMIFHNPGLWSDRTPIRLLLPRLIPSMKARSTLISVGIPAATVPESDPVETPPPASTGIDWLEINRISSSR
jgi:hypothetical protein